VFKDRKMMIYEFEGQPLNFYWTASAPCPYIDGYFERKIVTELGHHSPIRMHDTLSTEGFRRSHGILYKPACPSCERCIAVRVILAKFNPTRSQKRVLLWNKNLSIKKQSAIATSEQFEIFSSYQKSRHIGGDMSKMDFNDYKAMIEETLINTSIIEFRESSGRLLAVLLVDELRDGMSAVYSFYDPHERKCSLGVFMILWLIFDARGTFKDYVYLGFWVKGAKKMEYKNKFQPLEYYTKNGWVE